MVPQNVLSLRLIKWTNWKRCITLYVLFPKPAQYCHDWSQIEVSNSSLEIKNMHRFCKPALTVWRSHDILSLFCVIFLGYEWRVPVPVRCSHHPLHPLPESAPPRRPVRVQKGRLLHEVSTKGSSTTWGEYKRVVYYMRWVQKGRLLHEVSTERSSTTWGEYKRVICYIRWLQNYINSTVWKVDQGGIQSTMGDLKKIFST